MEKKMQLIELKKIYTKTLAQKLECDRLVKKREKVYQQMIKNSSSSSVKELRDLDHAIDLLGEDLEERVKIAKKQLIEAILQTHPHSQSIIYNKLCMKISSSHERKKQLTEQTNQLFAFRQTLDEGKKRMQSRGISGFLFRQNNKAILARIVRKAQIEAQRIYPYIVEKEMRNFLDIFLEEVDRPWNHQLYKIRFLELHKIFNDLMKTIEQKQIELEKNALMSEEELNIWIEQHTCSNYQSQ